MKMMMLPVLFWTGWLAMAFACADKQEHEQEHQYEQEHQHEYQYESEQEYQYEHARLRSRRHHHRRLPFVQPTKGNPFDMVILMDESSGMGTASLAFQTNVAWLFYQLALQAPGSRAGLVGYGFGYNASIALRILHPLTNFSHSFGIAALALISRGTAAPGYQAVYKTVGSSSLAQSMGFTQNRPFCLVLFSNEQSNGDGNVTQQMAIDALQNNLTTTQEPNQANARGMFVGVTTTDVNVYASYSPLAVATGGNMISIDTFTCNPGATVKEIVMGCNIAVNQLSLTPWTANLTAGQTHTLTIITRQRVDYDLYSKPNGKVILRALNGPDIGILFNGTTDSGGTKQVRYTPSLYETMTIKFQACLVTPPTACVATVATWTDRPVANKGS